MPTLNWLNRSETLNVAKNEPYRLLEHDSSLSYGDPDTGNMLIQGDNLNALKALLPYYAGMVKCIYIDPPYNTKSAFEHYDDSVEHSTWLSLLYPRLELLRELLSEEGSIWISIDDHEAHYLKVISDEIFGRKNFIANVVWQKRTSPDARVNLGSAHDSIIVYSKNIEKVLLNKVDLSAEQKSKFKNPDDDPKGPWVSTDFTAQGWRPNQMYELTSPSGKIFTPPDGRCWANIESVYLKLLKENKMYFGKTGTSKPRVKTYLSERSGNSSWTWWPNKEVGHNQEGKKEINILFGANNAFDTPKPERLIQRIISIASSENDIVLDSFLGSATTTAVCHKMKRKYLGIEIGDHAISHCIPRMKKVIDGEQGGVSESVNWQGGGGYRFYKLGNSVFDENGKINSNIRFSVLASHIWFSETKTPLPADPNTPLLGISEDVAYYLLFNGILGDKKPDGGNVLTSRVLKSIPEHNGPRVIYGERSMFGPARLKRESITFKQIPYDIKAR